MPQRYQPNRATIHKGGGYLFRRAHQNNVLHAGVDLSAPRGTVVVAPADGVVVSVERDNRSPFRGYDPESVVLRDDRGLFHLLAHLEPSNLVDPRDPDRLATPVEGKRFVAGQPIGRVGAFNHTHWELRTKFLKGDPMDDELVIANTINPLVWLEGGEQDSAIMLPELVIWTATRQAAAGGNGPWMLLLLLMLLND